MWQSGVESGTNKSNRRILIGVAAVAVSLLCCGCWNPMMVHPTAYTSAKALPAGRVELAGQFWPGAAAAVGLGRGWQLDGFYGYVGDDVVGGQVQLSATLLNRPPYYLAALGGYEYFKEVEDDTYHDFSGYRFSGGVVFSWYPAPDVVGIHLPMKVYQMNYEWPLGWSESSTAEFRDDEGSGAVLVPGFGVSLEQPHWALKAAFNAPTDDHIDRVELLPYFGLQVAVRF